MRLTETNRRMYVVFKLGGYIRGAGSGEEKRVQLTVEMVMHLWEDTDVLVQVVGRKKVCTAAYIKERTCLTQWDRTDLVGITKKNRWGAPSGRGQTWCRLREETDVVHRYWKDQTLCT